MRLRPPERSGTTWVLAAEEAGRVVARRITATTDAGNFPMAAAFRAAGYRNTETRIMSSRP